MFAFVIYVYIEKANLPARFRLDLHVHPHFASTKICCGITLHVLAGTCDDVDCILFSKSIIEIKDPSTVVFLFSSSVVHAGCCCCGSGSGDSVGSGGGGGSGSDGGGEISLHVFPYCDIGYSSLSSLLFFHLSSSFSSSLRLFSLLCRKPFSSSSTSLLICLSHFCISPLLDLFLLLGGRKFIIGKLFKAFFDVHWNSRFY